MTMLWLGWGWRHRYRTLLVGLLFMTVMGLMLGCQTERQVEDRQPPLAQEETVVASVALQGPHIYLDQGKRDAAQGYWQEAVAHYQKAVEIDSTYVAAHEALGHVYRENHQWQKALASYSQAIALNPDLVEALYYRATSYLALRGYAEAVADFSRVIEADPHYAYAYFGRGVAYWLEGRCLEAIENLEAFIDLSPEESVVAQARVYVSNLEGKASCFNPPPDAGEISLLENARSN